MGSHHRWRLGHRRESGATLVEYAMLVAVLALGTITSISALQDTAEAQIESTAAHIGERRSAVTTPPPPNNGGGGVGGSPTTTTTTTAPATTTTIAPTTTTTTTVPPATLVRSTWGQPVSTQSSNQWYATVSLDILDDNDVPVSGATVTMTIDQRTGNGSWQQLGAPFDAVTTASGGFVVTSPNVQRAGNNRIEQLRFSVLSVNAAGLTWDPQTVSVVASRP